MELKITRNKKGQFESAKGTAANDKGVTVRIADDKDLMKRVECAVQAFSDPDEYNDRVEDKPLKVDINHRTIIDFGDRVIDVVVKAVVVVFLTIATAYIAGRI